VADMRFVIFFVTMDFAYTENAERMVRKMFDCSVYNKLNVHSVSGTLIKSHPKSRIVRFHMTSGMANAAFDVRQPEINHEKVVILQVMLCGDKELLVEYIREADCGGEEE